MRIIRHYLMRAIVSMSALVLAVLLAMGGFIEFVGQLNDVGVGEYGIPEALLYAALKLPKMAFIMLPMVVLLGSMLGLGALANRSELIAIRGAGVSLMHLAHLVLVTGLMLAVIGAVLGQYVAPRLDHYARQFRSAAQHGETGLDTGKSTWVRDGNVILNIDRLGDDASFGGVYLFTIDREGKLLSRIGHADSAGVDENNEWILNNYKETVFTGTGVVTRRARRSYQTNGLNAELFGMMVLRPSSLDGAELFHYVRYLQRNGLDARRYEVAFWNRIASAVAIAPMCVLALPFVFGRLSRSGAGARTTVGVIIGVAYFLASRSLADGGTVFKLDAALMAWLPTLALMVITLVALARAR
jgi:lipopolysaccharide export system permease protein